jgi:hypothetical protein
MLFTLGVCSSIARNATLVHTLKYPCRHHTNAVFPKLFARGTLLASKSTHGSSYPCSRKYSVHKIGSVQKLVGPEPSLLSLDRI